jgi:hypothetical protein
MQEMKLSQSSSDIALPAVDETRPDPIESALPSLVTPSVVEVEPHQTHESPKPAEAYEYEEDFEEMDAHINETLLLNSEYIEALNVAHPGPAMSVTSSNGAKLRAAFVEKVEENLNFNASKSDCGTRWSSCSAVNTIQAEMMSIAFKAEGFVPSPAPSRRSDKAPIERGEAPSRPDRNAESVPSRASSRLSHAPSSVTETLHTSRKVYTTIASQGSTTPMLHREEVKSENIVQPSSHTSYSNRYEQPQHLFDSNSEYQQSFSEARSEASADVSEFAQSAVKSMIERQSSVGTKYSHKDATSRRVDRILDLLRVEDDYQEPGLAPVSLPTQQAPFMEQSMFQFIQVYSTMSNKRLQTNSSRLMKRR